VSLRLWNWSVLIRDFMDVMDVRIMTRESMPDSLRCSEVLDNQGNLSAVVANDSAIVAVTGLEDAHLRIFDMASKTCNHHVRGHYEKVTALSLSSDGKWLASGSTDGSAKLWDVDTARTMRIYNEAHAMGVTSIAIHQDARFFVTGGADHAISLFSGRTEHARLRMHCHSAPVTGIGIHPSMKAIVWTSADGTLRAWSLDGTERRCVNAHVGGVKAMAVRPDFSAAATIGTSGGLKVWNLRNFAEVIAIDSRETRFSCVAIAPRAPIAAPGDVNGRIKLWDLKRGRCVHTIQASDEPIAAVALTHGGLTAMVAAGSALSTWSLRKGFSYRAPYVMCQVRNTDNLRELQDTYDERLAAAHRALKKDDTEAALAHLRAARQVPGFGRRPEVMTAWRQVSRYCAHARSRGAWPIGALDGHTDRIRSLTASPSGELLLSASDDNTFRLWDTRDSTCLRTFTFNAVTTAIALFRAEEIAMLGGDDGWLRHVHMRTGEKMSAWPAHQAPVRQVEVSFDGRWAVSAADGQRVRVWDIASMSLLRELKSANSTVLCTDLSRDARQVAIATDDRKLRLWDLQSGRVCDVFGPREGFVEPIGALRYSEDGQWLVIADRNGVVWKRHTNRSTASQKVSQTGTQCATMAISADAQTSLMLDANGTT
jgi:WD40 repeat protein